MNSKRILSFLNDIAANNNRAWFLAHKVEYMACKADFEKGIDQLIHAIAQIDPSIAHLSAKDCVYRFYRDIRFSSDKSPYKRHFGAYICAKGKKSFYGGYYIHLQPGNCLVSLGAYYLPTNILTSCRNEIMGNIDQWLECVEKPEFLNLFGQPGEGSWDGVNEASDKGFGLSRLKKAPKGFPVDYQYLNYLKLKDYTLWNKVDDGFFGNADWIERSCNIFKVGKPMMDFVNSVIGDYVD